MLFYLDNFLSADPAAAARGWRWNAPCGSRCAWLSLRRPFRRQQARTKRSSSAGLNENYGRELMELHTLGVDGGYTQKDVTEVARCFTGWTIEKPRENPRNSSLMRACTIRIPKVVLGKKIHAGGMKDGEASDRPAGRKIQTPRNLFPPSWRGRFVSDTPPPELVDRMAKTFQKVRRRHPGSDADDDLFAGILVARSVPRESEDAIRIGSVLGASAGHGRGYTDAVGALGRTHRRASVPMPATDWVFG